MNQSVSYTTVILAAVAVATAALLALPHKTAAAATLLKPPNNLGLVGYWSFDEGTSTKATDFSGNGKTGTLSGATLPSWANGRRGSAIDFDGTDDYVSVGNVSSSIQTVSFWMKADVTTSKKIIDMNGTAQVELDGSSQVTATGFTSPTVYVDGSSASSVVDTGWHHVVVTTGTAVNASAVDIGRVSTGYFDGRIDDVRMYTRALGASEVAKLYGGGSNPGGGGAVQAGASTQTLQQGTSLATGLVGHWSFDGPDVTTVVADKSGQGNNGYFIDGATSSAKVSGKLGQALQFDGVDDAVLIASTFTAATATISAWIYPTSLAPGTSREIFNAGDIGSDSVLFDLAPDSDAINITCDGGGTNASISLLDRISVNNWYHLLVVRNASNEVTFYINGAQAGATQPCGAQSPSPYMAIGSRYLGGGRPFKGKIDDFRVYNRALTPAEIKQLYNLGATTIKP